jgi:hypothetical protein
MSTEGDDDLERRLRDVLHSRGLDVPVAPDAMDRIHSGARRRQQRRTIASATTAFGAVAIIGGSIAINSTVRDNRHAVTAVSARPSSVSLEPSPTEVSPTPPPAASPITSHTESGPASSEVSVAPTAVTSGSVPASGVFNPVSFSAVGVNDYWVLGYTTTTQSDGTSITTTIKRTTDGGQRFDSLPGAFSVLQTHLSFPSNDIVVSDIRFGDANDGWAFGPSLYATTDAGTTWRAVTQIPGDVVDLVAANNKVWAVVSIAATAGSASPSATPQYAIYSSSYGKSAQRWSRVTLPIALGATQPSIVDQDGTVTLLASGPSRSGDLDHALVATKGGTFTDHVGPCFQELGGYMSNSATGIWAVCPTGSLAGVAVSGDRGATWASVANLPPPSFPNPGSGGVGAIDNKHAVLFDLGKNDLVRVTVGSSPVQITSGPKAIGLATNFIGFTTPSLGFAIISGQSSRSQLWRTTDGGETWTAVAF